MNAIMPPLKYLLKMLFKLFERFLAYLVLIDDGAGAVLRCGDSEKSGFRPRMQDPSRYGVLVKQLVTFSKKMVEMASNLLQRKNILIFHQFSRGHTPSPTSGGLAQYCRDGHHQVVEAIRNLNRRLQFLLARIALDTRSA